MLTLLPKGAHRCRWHRWCTLSREYLRKFSKKFEMAVLVYSDAWGKLIHEKNQKSKISWHCPFNKHLEILLHCWVIWKVAFRASPSPSRASHLGDSFAQGIHIFMWKKHLEILLRCWVIMKREIPPPPLTPASHLGGWNWRFGDSTWHFSTC